MRFLPFSAFWSRVAVSFALFVALGSTALVFWLQRMAERESEHVFTALARTNAQFIKSARLAPVSRVVEPLGQVLGMRMFFRRTGEALVPQPEGPLAGHLDKVVPGRGIVHIGRDAEAIAMPIEPGLDLLLVRPVEPKQEFLRQPSTHIVLGFFWLLSLALAWSVTRGVVRPLRQLASRLPVIENDMEASLPGAERRDEIGEVARAYLSTRAQLASERERRIAAERFALLGRMATGLAHEIHNPLSAIRLHAQLLSTAAPGELAAANAESVPVVLSEAERIESLVNQWMFLARPAPPQVARTCLGEIVAGVARMEAALARHAGVEIEERVPRDLTVDVDRRRFTQAVCNVVVNAIQAMPGGGRLTVEGGTAGSEVFLVFQDTGGGFSLAALARHAELFYSEKEGGMGIGLSVSSEILKAHGGALRVENTPGLGAKVTFILPLSSLSA